MIDGQTALLLERGKLEQTCRRCGRWEAAHHHCSWCYAPTGPDDWYRNGDMGERLARRPKDRPENPPAEYAAGEATWPPEWGPFPRQRAPRQPQTPPKGKLTPAAVSLSASVLTLGLL